MPQRSTWIALFDEGGDRVATATASGFDGAFEPFREKLESGSYPPCMKRALERGAPVFIESSLRECDGCQLAGGEDHACLCRPMFLADQIYGVESIVGDLELLRREIGESSITKDGVNSRSSRGDLEGDRLHEIFERNRDGLVIVDTTGRIIDANPAFCQMLGYSLDELCEMRNFYEITPERWREWEEREIWQKRLLQRGYSGLYEKEYIRKDGTVFPVELRSYAVRDEQGELDYLWGMARDISELKRAEQTLRESEKYLRNILDTISDGFWVLDREGRMVQVNDAYCRLTGYSREELLRLSISDIDADETPDDTAARIARIIAQGEETFETHHRRKDGSVFPAEISVTYLDDNGGQFVCICRDLTERRAWQERLALLGRMLDEAPASITIHDTDGHFLFANKATLTLHGYESMEEFLSINLHDLDVPESAAKLEPRFRQIAEEGQARFESSHYRKDGTTFPLDVLAKKISWEGRPAVLSVAADLSERYRMESQNRQLAAIIQRSHDFIGVADADQKAFYVNPAGRKMVGLKGDEAVRKTKVDDYFLPEDLPYVRETIMPAVKEQGRWAGEFRFRHFQTGEPVHVLYELFLTENPETGNLSQFATVTRDITEHKKADEALRESERRLRESQRTARIGHVEFSVADGGILWSDQMFSLYERDLDLGPPNYDEVMALHQPDDAAELERLVWRAVETGEPYAIDLNVNLPSGREAIYHIIGTPLRDEEGKVTRITGTVQDVTERKLAEREREKLREQLTQAQKMESVGRLAGGVAHDFNNMLNVIIGHAELLLDELPSESPLREGLDEIERSAQHSADLTRQLLAFARKQTVAPKVLDLNATIASMLKMLRRLIGEDIALRWKPGPLSAQVRIDPSQVDQILANLCVNARDAIGHAPGTVTIETEQVSLAESDCKRCPDCRPGEYVKLTVSDDGAGMSVDTLEHVFEPFFTTKGVGEGTGLGLATIYGITKQNNGFVIASSELGEGATFEIFLPVHQSPRSERRRAVEEGAEPPRGDETVLLVEDEPSILRLARKILERQGYTTLVAETPGEAIRLAREYSGKIHLLITDVVMPEMNGRDLAKNLLALYPEIKRLFMSGYTADVIAHQGVLDEGVRFIQKPFTVKSLSEKVREALEN